MWCGKPIRVLVDTALVRAWYLWCGKTIRVLVDTALVRAWYLWCGKPIRVFVGVRWSEFRCWFPEFLDCRSHELAYRAHSTFRPVPAEQGLNNTTYLFCSRSDEFTNTYAPSTLPSSHHPILLPVSVFASISTNSNSIVGICLTMHQI